MTDPISVMSIAVKGIYTLVDASKKASREERERLAGLYKAIAGWMRDVASALRRDDMPPGLLEAYLNYSTELTAALKRTERYIKDPVARLKQQLALSDMLSAFTSLILLWTEIFPPKEQLTTAQRKTLEDSARELEKTAAQLDSWVVSLRA